MMAKAKTGQLNLDRMLWATRRASGLKPPSKGAGCAVEFFL
jgi:hypothetical protein